MAEIKNASLTTDLVLFARDAEGALRVLTVVRSQDSDAYPGATALPGGYLDDGESFRGAAIRELAEETGIHSHQIDTNALRQVGVYDAPTRDPRGRVVSVAFAALLDQVIPTRAGSDAESADWPLVAAVLARGAAFDHLSIIGDALDLLGLSPVD